MLLPVNGHGVMHGLLIDRLRVPMKNLTDVGPILQFLNVRIVHLRAPVRPDFRCRYSGDLGRLNERASAAIQASTVHPKAKFSTMIGVTFSWRRKIAMPVGRQ